MINSSFTFHVAYLYIYIYIDLLCKAYLGGRPHDHRPLCFTGQCEGQNIPSYSNNSSRHSQPREPKTCQKVGHSNLTTLQDNNLTSLRHGDLKEGGDMFVFCMTCHTPLRYGRQEKVGEEIVPILTSPVRSIRLRLPSLFGLHI